MNPGVKTAHEFLDAILAEVAKRSAAQGRPVTCCAGCSACCDEPAYAVRDEVERMLSGLNSEKRALVTQATRQWLDTVRDSPLLAEFQPHAVAWRALKATCPFLHNNLCLAYKLRPVGCRLFMVSGPRAHCEDVSKRAGQVFIECDEAGKVASAAVVLGAERLITDHIGALLASILLGEELKTGARTAYHGQMLEAGKEGARESMAEYGYMLQ